MVSTVLFHVLVRGARGIVYVWAYLANSTGVNLFKHLLGLLNCEFVIDDLCDKTFHIIVSLHCQNQEYSLMNILGFNIVRSFQGTEKKWSNLGFSFSGVLKMYPITFPDTYLKYLEVDVYIRIIAIFLHIAQVILLLCKSWYHRYWSEVFITELSISSRVEELTPAIFQSVEIKYGKESSYLATKPDPKSVSIDDDF